MCMYVCVRARVRLWSCACLVCLCVRSHATHGHQMGGDQHRCPVGRPPQVPRQKLLPPGSGYVTLLPPPIHPHYRAHSLIHAPSYTCPRVAPRFHHYTHSTITLPLHTHLLPSLHQRHGERVHCRDVAQQHEACRLRWLERRTCCTHHTCVIPRTPDTHTRSSLSHRRTHTHPHTHPPTGLVRVGY